MSRPTTQRASTSHRGRPPWPRCSRGGQRYASSRSPEHFTALGPPCKPVSISHWTCPSGGGSNITEGKSDHENATYRQITNRRGRSGRRARRRRNTGYRRPRLGGQRDAWPSWRRPGGPASSRTWLRPCCARHPASACRRCRGRPASPTGHRLRHRLVKRRGLGDQRLHVLGGRDQRLPPFGPLQAVGSQPLGIGASQLTSSVYLTQLLQAGSMSIFPSQLINHHRAVPSYPDAAITPAASETAPNTERTTKMLRPINIAKVKQLRPKTIAFTTLRRLRVIVALGALFCVLGGVVTASPALAGRGHKWQFRATHALHPVSVVLRVQGPGDARGRQQGIYQDPQDRGRVHDVSFHRRHQGLVHEPANWEDHNRERCPGRGRPPYVPTALSPRCIRGGNGPFILTPADAKRFGLPTVSVTAGALSVRGRGERGHHLTVPA